IFTQMLSYLARIYEQQTEKQKPLLQRYLPNYELAHFILTNESIDNMNFSVYSKTLFEIMKSIAYGDLSTELPEIIDLKSIFQSGEKGLVKFRNLLKYAYTRGNLTAEQVTQVISNISAETKEGEMITIRELMKQEYKQGRQEGREEGLLKGVQELLIKQLERRFGPLSENEHETVHNCKNQDKLESASIILVEDKTKEEVLAQLV
ncbi:MAG: hypothetical protein H3C43_05980, partial [Leptonema sp. (in: Bacteria)]|nr:hypothetical protein [Leptonema sp. (in: bacteria)]